MAPCAIKWCGNSSQTCNFKKNGITFHRFPKDPNIKEKWLNATRRENWFPSVYSKICSRHFAEDCFINMKNRRLLSSAVPTLFLPILTNNGDPNNVPDNPGPSVTPLNISNPSVTPKRKRIFRESPSNYNSPIKKCFSRRIIELSDNVIQKNRLIKNSIQKTGHLCKKIASLKSILNDLEKHNLINSENVNLLSKIGVTSKELVRRQLIKSNKKGCTVRKKYSPELKTFALTLHFYSTKAYSYVRKNFQTCLPSIKTISKWYQSVNGKPGFTKEAFIALKHKASQCEGELICALIFDEIKIKNKVEYVPATQRTFGYEDFGGEIKTDCTEECIEALVFLVVGLYKRFKVPIGYFLTKGTNGEQKANLVLQALELCNHSNVIIKALTFDGCPANFTMAKKLGCILDLENLKTSFKHPVTNADVFIFLDPVHMLKLIRNAFEHYKIFYDDKGRKIEWDYLKYLQELQDSEQFHLANKLRVTHIQFKQNIMKVKLAVQIFSRSVAVALQFCKNELKLSAFQEVDATAEMLLLINDLFDILDSQVHGYGFKRALNQDNAPAFFEKLECCKKFLVSLNAKKNQSCNIKLIKSPRSTGFLGFCVAIESARGMYNDLIVNESSCIKYIPFHKISQDHIELLFACIRSHGGSNDNPTPRLLESIYKKILIHTELVEVSTGNCVPLEQISILHCSSAIQRINLTTLGEENKEITDVDIEQDVHSALSANCLSQFAESAVEYIAGFVASSLLKQIKCKTCVAALVSLNEDKSGFVAYRVEGGFIYPSRTVVKICRRCELIIKSYIKNLKSGQPREADFLVTKTLSTFVGEPLFSEIIFHQYQFEETNHIVDLTSSIMHKYISTRLAFLAQSSVQKPIVRRIYTKLIHFKNN